MKKMILLACSYITLLYAVEEVQQVVDITPDRSSDKMVLPKPPSEVRAIDMISTSSKINNAKKSAVYAKEKKPFEKMSKEQQISLLKHKIDKLRKRSHEFRAKLRAVKEQVAQLRTEMAELNDHLNQVAPAPFVTEQTRDSKDDDVNDEDEIDDIDEKE